MKKLLVLLTAFFGFGCTHMTPNRMISAEQCSQDERYPRLFNVIENNEKQIVVELGPFAKFFNLSDKEYSYKVDFKGSLLNERSTIAKKREESANIHLFTKTTVNETERIVVPVTKTGIYLFTIYQDEDYRPNEVAERHCLEDKIVT